MMNIQGYIELRELQDLTFLEARNGPDPVKKVKFTRVSDIRERTRRALKVIESIGSKTAANDETPLFVQAGFESQADADIFAGHLILTGHEPFMRLAALGGFTEKPKYKITFPVDDTTRLVLTDSYKRRTVDYSVSTPDLYERTRQVLIEDIANVCSLCEEQGLVPTHYAFNMHSEIFREFGASIYGLWLDDKMEQLCEQYDISSVFSDESHLNRLEFISPRFHVDETLVQEVRNVEGGEKMRDFYRDKIGWTTGLAGKDKFYKKNSIKILELMLDHNLHGIHGRYAPASKPQNFKLWLKNVLDKLELIESQSSIPFKTKNIIMAQPISANELRQKINLFESYGLTPEQYGPYLHLFEIDLVINELMNGAVSEAITASTQRWPKSPRTVMKSTYDSVAAVYYLSQLGEPVIEIIEKYYPGHSFESLAYKVRLFVENGFTIEDIPTRAFYSVANAETELEKLFNKKVKAKRSIRAMRRAKENLASFLKERGHKDIPEWLFTSKCPPQTIIRRIKYIEQCGVDFEGSGMWSWLYLGPDHLEAKIQERLSEKLRAQKLAELLSERGLTVPDWWSTKRGGDHVIYDRIIDFESRYKMKFEGQWSWLNVPALAERGAPSSWVAQNRSKYIDDISYIFELSEYPESWNRFDPIAIFRKLRFTRAYGLSPNELGKSIYRDSTEKLTAKVDKYIRSHKPGQDGVSIYEKYNILARSNASSEHTCRLAMYMTDEECETLRESEVISSEYIKILQEREQKELQVIKILILNRASIADIEYFLEFYPIDILAEKLSELQRNTKGIFDINELHQILD